MIASFDQAVQRCKQATQRRTLAVAGAADAHVIEAVAHARRAGIAQSILVGDREKIRTILDGLGEKSADYEICHAEAGEEGQCAVDLIRGGDANVLMKGMLETSQLLRPVVKRENDLRTGGVMSHCAFFEMPDREKILGVTDGGMVLYPTFEDKRAIVENTVSAYRALGYETTKIACLCGVETVNPKMIETVDASQLQACSQAGELPHCIVQGPISYDIACSRELAEYKGYPSDHCGDFDAFLVPTLAAGNFLSKSYIMHLHAPMAGLVLGAKAPIVLNSRGATAEEKFYSIAMAALVAAGTERI